MLGCHLQSPYREQRKRQDAKVRDDIDDSARDQEGPKIKTRSWKKGFPDLLSWRALKACQKRDNDITDQIQPDQDLGNVVGNALPIGHEYPQVLQQYRQLRNENQAGIVDFVCARQLIP